MNVSTSRLCQKDLTGHLCHRYLEILKLQDDGKVSRSASRASSCCRGCARATTYAEPNGEYGETREPFISARSVSHSVARGETRNE